MKRLVLDFASICLQAKNKEKYFLASETHPKGQPVLKGSLYEHITLTWRSFSPLVSINSAHFVNSKCLFGLLEKHPWLSCINDLNDSQDTRQRKGLEFKGVPPTVATKGCTVQYKHLTKIVMHTGCTNKARKLLQKSAN